MSARGVTVSTVGLVPAIDKLAAEDIPVTLALSLHAPDDELRDELVPINTRFKVDEAIDAAHRYYLRTGRRVSIEYALIRDINDQAWRADLLGKKLTARGKGWVHVNPIPLNPTPAASGPRRAPASSRTSSSACAPGASRRRCVTRAVPTSTARAVSSSIAARLAPSSAVGANCATATPTATRTAPGGAAGSSRSSPLSWSSG